MTADQLRECREAFMKWFRTTSPQTLDFTIQSTIREFAYQAWKDATIKANTRPTAVASHAEGEVAFVPSLAMMRVNKSGEVGHASCWLDPSFIGKTVYVYAELHHDSHPPRSGDEASDAARYRWLRDHVFYADGKYRITQADHQEVEPRAYADGGERFEASIDAAMAARGGS
ncbi:hypothetical protein [Dyella jiangningensis]